MEATVFIRDDGEANATGVTAAIPWWSFTKTAFSIALLRLSERNRINLDETVEGHSFTPSQLLRHEAGLPDYGSLSAYHADVEARRAPWPVADLLKTIEADRLRYEPGVGWAYSNIGYREIARLIEKASDQPLADALTDHVFTPAEITTAKLAATPDDLTGVHMGDAVGYHPGWVYHGLLVGTAMDASRLLHRFLEGDLVGANSLSRMLEGRPLPQFRSALHPDPAYGLGLMLQAKNPLHHPIGHSGSGPGSRIAVYGQQNRTCVVWAATTSGVDPEAEVFRALRNGGF